jgi:type IV pilus assembly protein PilP
MANPINKYLTGLPLILCVLSGCAWEGSNSDLRTYVSQTKSAPKGGIEPLPPLRTYEAFIYNATTLRSPFDAPIQAKELVQASDPKVKPDFGREPEFLEGFPFESYSMVGSLEKNGLFWALVKGADGGVNKVTVGNFLGKDHGKVVSASTTQIDVVEIVSDGLGGWLQRPRTLKLSEKE